MFHKILLLFQSSNSVFSAGLDILEMYNPTKDNLAVFWTTLQNTWLSLYRTSIPTVAAINVRYHSKREIPRESKIPGVLVDFTLCIILSYFYSSSQGHAPAGGCLLALSCEYRVMVGPKFTIGLNETQLGIVAPPWYINTGITGKIFVLIFSHLF